MTRAARVLSALLALALASCVLVDRPMLALRSVAGGIHNQCQVSGIRPFYLADGRLALSANGALVVEREAGSHHWVALTDEYAEIDDPELAADGHTLLCASGRDQVTAGGGHNDHVFQLYAFDLESRTWRRLTHSRRAEVLPRATCDGSSIVFARRAEYDGWTLGKPWGPDSLFVARADGSGERRLTQGLFHPVAGLALVDGDTRVLFGSSPEGTARPALYALDFPQGGDPRIVLEGAYLPTRIQGSDEVLAALVFPDGHGVVRLDREGHVLREYPLGLNAIGGLALSPDGRTIALSDLDPAGGSFGEYRLWLLDVESGTARTVERLPYRVKVRFKPLDIVKPPSWWFRSDAPRGAR